MTTIPVDSALGKMVIAENDSLLKKAQEQFPEVDWTRWVVLAADDASTDLLDRRTVKCKLIQQDVCECTVWLWTHHTPPKENFKSWKQILEVHCEDSRFRFTRAVAYRTDGSVDETSIDAKWETPVPDTFSEGLIDQVCQSIASDFRFFRIYLPRPKSVP